MNTVAKGSFNQLLLLLLFLLVTVGKSGFWIMPNLQEQFMISQSLLHNPLPAPESHYLLTNYLQPMLFGLAGGGSLKAYAWYALGTTVLFYVGFVLWYVRRRRISPGSSSSLLAVGVFTVFVTPAYWIGMDGATVLLLFLTMVFLYSRWSILFAVLLAWQHFEHGLVGFLLLAGTLVIMAARGNAPVHLAALRRTGVVILALFAGKGLLLVFFRLAHLQPAVDLPSLLGTEFPENFRAWTGNWPAILFSLFGTGWLLVLIRARKIWPIFPAVLAAFLFLMLVQDKTRTGTLILFPVIMYALCLNPAFWDFLTPKWLCVLLVVHLATPTCFFWQQVNGGLWHHSPEIVSRLFKPGASFDDFDGWKPFTQDRFAPTVYTATDLPSSTGQLENGDVVSEPGRPGLLTDGPMAPLSKGAYLARIYYSTDPGPTGQVVGNWDVERAATPRVIQQGNLLSGYHRIAILLFACDRDQDVAIRTYSLGRQRISIDRIEVQQLY